MVFFGLRRPLWFECLANAWRRFWSRGVAIHNTRESAATHSSDKEPRGAAQSK